MTKSTGSPAAATVLKENSERPVAMTRAMPSSPRRRRQDRTGSAIVRSDRSRVPSRSVMKMPVTARSAGAENSPVSLMVGMGDSLDCLAMGVARVKILATAQVFRLKVDRLKVNRLKVDRLKKKKCAISIGLQS